MLLRQLLVFFGGFLCEGETRFLRPILVLLSWGLQFGEVRTVSASGCLDCYTLKFWTLLERVRQPVAHCFSFASEEFFLVSDTGGVAGSSGVLTPQATRLQLVSETAALDHSCGHTHAVEHASETTTTTTTTAAAATTIIQSGEDPF